ncbi:Non-heme chloroperoxidase [Labilithrix luteola]|uniref:Non-heme chloroperoxidase n=1 Tax=Labilithrix luteola TaxID=1391654 RepID=A0A0K1PL89_9BACT|nr:alpha/beta hydrolase [Labilithrix luteola]AKU94285.1 Non-heme chloroperoxidase [Labilithrix luteola]
MAQHAPFAAPPTDVRTFETTTTDGVRIAIDDAGPRDAPCVVFIHGLAQSRRAWRGQLTGELTKDFRCVAFDLRGHGDSDKPNDAAAYTEPGRFASDVDAVLSALGSRKVVLVPWSYGGAVVGDYLRQHGESRVAGIFAVAAAVRMGRTASAYFGPVMMKNARGLMSEDDAMYRSSALAFIAGCMRLPEDGFGESAVSEMMRVPAYVRRAMLSRSEDYLAEYTTGRFPLAAIQGAHDEVVLGSLAEELVGNRAELHVVAEAAHVPFVDAKSDFERILRSFARRAFASNGG